MRRSTRNDIMDTARRLFSERGYNAVSIQDLADELGISKGNLTYHFKRKEQIVEALLRQNAGDGLRLAVPGSIGALDTLFRHQYNVVRENAFYFWHYDQLAQLSPEISAMQRGAQQTLRSVYRDSFSVLLASGRLRAEDAAGRKLAGEQERLIDALILTAVYWLPYRRLMQDAEDGGPEALCAQCWSLLIPWLSARGHAEFRALTAISDGEA